MSNNMFDFMKVNINRINDALVRETDLLFDGSVQVIAPSVKIENEDVINWDKVLPCLERIMRTCYKSEGLTCEGSDKKLVGRLVHDTKHRSTIEHAMMVTFRMVIDRGISHEVVRHRIAGHSQESTRYVDYVKKGGGQLVYPIGLINESDYVKNDWYTAACHGFETYHRFRKEYGWSPQMCRGFLPHFAKTELVSSFDLNSLRNFFSLRLAKSAHPDMRVVAESAFALTREKLEVIFDDFDDKVVLCEQ